MRSSFVFHAIFSFLLAITVDIASSSMSRPNCPDRCGNVTIPYPFGIGSSCSANSSFTITCDQNSTDGLRPFLSSIDMEVVNISVLGTVIVNQPVSPLNCSSRETRSLGEWLSKSPFTISAHYNTFVNLGCMNSVSLRPNRTATIGGCMAMYDRNATATSCNGVNCCQVTIPPDLKEVLFTSENVRSSNRTTCGYAFLVDKKWFQHGYNTYRGLRNDLLNPYDQDFHSVPVVLDWEFHVLSEHGSCRHGTSYIYPEFHKCTDFMHRWYQQHGSYPGLYPPYYMGSEFDQQAMYRVYQQHDSYPGLYPQYFDQNEYGSSTKQCFCSDGFEGNPYVREGCTDECSKNLTSWGCLNGENSAHTSDFPSIGGRSRLEMVRMPLIGIGSGIAALLLLVGAWRCYRVIRRIIKANRRHMFFKRNGGLLLEQELSSSNNGLEKGKLFSAKELAHATEQYNENRVLGGGGQGTVYKGMLTDGRIVAIKKSTRVDEGDIEDFINEVVILSQINHRNIVKLLGWCLETEVPILVYEFISNGTLFQHIHDPSEDFSLSWEMRLHIATDVAGALSYLHSAASAPIYHRDIKSTNILLDDKYRAKVADFGTSRSVSIDKTHLTTRVLGTFGYLDPEYFQSSQFTEKSDVYSFGVVMVELLTGEKAISSIRSEVGRSLATHFLHSMEESLLLDILDERVVKEGTREELFAMADLSRKCLHLNGKRRRTMKEVATGLERIQMMKEGSITKPHEGDKDFHAIDLSEQYDFLSISESMCFDIIVADSLDVLPPSSQEP